MHTHVSVFTVRQAGMYEKSRYGRLMRIPKGSSTVDKLCLRDGQSQFSPLVHGPIYWAVVATACVRASIVLRENKRLLFGDMLIQVLIQNNN